MNRLTILIVLLHLFLLNLSAQIHNVKIYGQIVGYDGKSEFNYYISSMNLDLPYDGMGKIKPDSLGRFTITKHIEGVMFFRLIEDNDTVRHDCKLLVQPNKNYSFISQGQSTKKTKYWEEPYSPDIFTRQANANDNHTVLKMDFGQMLYNQIENGTQGSLYRHEWDLMKPESLINCLNTKINNQVSKFDKLLSDGEIDKEFYQIA